MKKEEIIANEEKYELPVYPKRDIAIVKGKGAKVWDSEGNEYIDCTAGVGVANVGYCNEHVGNAVKKQMDVLTTCYSMFPNDVRATYVEKLVKAAPQSLEKVFMCNSGTETIEAAIKFARASTGKRGIIGLMRGFHGKTIGSLGAMWNKGYKDPFLLVDPDFHHVPANNIDKLAAAIDDSTAAVIMELVQGEGGVRPLDEEFVSAVSSLCTEKGVLLIIDEVQTGFGRTGKLFCCEHYNLQPDVLCCAKGMANGIPMGACLVSAKIQVPKKSHTSTFGGNPIACAAGLAVLECMEQEDLPAKAASLGKYAMEQLSLLESDRIRTVRGRGLMIGIELKEKAGPYLQPLMDRGILVLLAGSTVIRLLPPLVITKEEIDSVVSAIAEVLA